MSLPLPLRLPLTCERMELSPCLPFPSLEGLEKLHVQSRFRWTVAQSIVLEITWSSDKELQYRSNSGRSCSPALTLRYQCDIPCPRFGVAEGLPVLVAANNFRVSRTSPKPSRRHMVSMASLVSSWDPIISYTGILPRSRARRSVIL